MAKLAKDLPDVVAVKVDDKGRTTKGPDGKSLTKTFTGQNWKLMGSDPVTNGGWKVQDGKTPAEIVETGNLTGATLGDGAGSGVDGKNEEASEGKVGEEVDETQKNAASAAKKEPKTDEQKAAEKAAKAAKKAATSDDEETLDVTSKIV